MMANEAFWKERWKLPVVYVNILVLSTFRKNMFQRSQLPLNPQKLILTGSEKLNLVIYLVTQIISGWGLWSKTRLLC